MAEIQKIPIRLMEMDLLRAYSHQTKANKDQISREKDQRINGKDQSNFSLAHSISSNVNGPLEMYPEEFPCRV